jgi:hypothetical protein
MYLPQNDDGTFLHLMTSHPFSRVEWKEALKLSGEKGKWQGVFIVDRLDI